MKARNRKKEEQLKRLRQKHIQSAFYETAGPSESIRNNRVQKRPDDLGIENMASRVRALLAAHHLRRSRIEKKQTNGMNGALAVNPIETTQACHI